jgi:hypothetical protein
MLSTFLITQTDVSHQHEAAKACAPDTALPPGTSRSAGHGRRYHGVVGIGARDQTLAAPGPQVAGGPRYPGFSREAHRRRRKDLLPRNPMATRTPWPFTKMIDAPLACHT